MFSDFGFDMISLVGGTGVGLVKLLIDGYNQRQTLLLEKQFDDIQKARQVKNPFMQWTRRIMALSITAVIVLYPLLAAGFGWALNVPYLHSNGGFISFFVGDVSLKWYTFPNNGLTLLPIMIPATMYIIGFYFGSGGTRR